MKPRLPRLAVRAIILHRDRLMIVNAFPGGVSDLWCVPGGGVHAGHSLPANLAREVFEECGVQVCVGDPCLVNEFHEPISGFHQVELFFRCLLVSPAFPREWKDPEGVVIERRLVTREELRILHHKPASLEQVAWGVECHYDPLEEIVR